jgi:O-antigen/teichoic acid export membrane protein
MSTNKIAVFFINSPIGKRIASSPKALELFKSSFWSIIGAIFSKGLVFISWIIVARILGSEGYGQFGIVRSTVLMFTTFAGFSLGITASKHVAEFVNLDKEKTGRILGLTLSFGTIMGSVVAVIFYSLSSWLAKITLNAPEIEVELKIGALILFFSSLNGAQIGALQGFSAFKKIARINIIQAVVSFPLFVVGALYFGIYGTIWAFAFSYVFICILSYFELKSETSNHGVEFDFRNSWMEKGMLFNYSLPAFLSGLMVTPVKWYVDSLLVSKSGFIEMGVFTAALTFNNIILVGASMVSGPFIAIMAKDKYNDRDTIFSKINILAPWAIGLFVCLPFLIFPEFGSVLFGDSFGNSSFEITFIFVLLYTIVLMFKQGLARVIAVYDLQWWGFFSNIIWACVLIISIFSLNHYSAPIFALSYLIAYVINTIVIIPVYFRKDIVPRSTLSSLESLLIWVVVGVAAFIGYDMSSYLLRSFILFISFCLVTLLFYRILKSRKKKIQ